MESITQIPDWFGTAVLGAVIAAAGYVAKLILEWIGEVQTRIRNRRAQLSALHSLLMAGKAAFNVQCENRDRLAESLFKRDPNLDKSALGYEELFTEAYPDMTEKEKELHMIIRTITINTVQPLNESLLEWLQKDDYFKARTWGKGLKVQVANQLATLESHLLLWVAKYKVWMPDNPAHSLVYLADEKKHGVRFPTDLQDNIQKLLKRRR